jgi:mono/diheme cytochrome c family protein
MIRLRSPHFCLLSCLAFCGQGAAAETGKLNLNQAEFFEKSVRPLLAENCFACHGPMKQKGGLRVDSRAALLGGGDSGPALVAGQPESSRVLQAIRYGGDLRMPPKGRLADEKIGILARWIKMGAPWPEAACTPFPRLTNARCCGGQPLT